MGKHKLFYIDAKIVRDHLNEAIELATQLQEMELILVQKLYEIDQKKYYLRYGHKSLSGFCQHGLLFSRIQTQRIVTLVRRYELNP